MSMSKTGAVVLSSVSAIFTLIVSAFSLAEMIALFVSNLEALISRFAFSPLTTTKT